jgi:cytochrome b561
MNDPRAIGLEIVAFRSQWSSELLETLLMTTCPPQRAAQAYNPGLRTLHWLMAALIFVALPLGVWASLLPGGAMRSEILFVHKSIGMTVLCLVALRIVWRVIAGAPAYAEPLGRLIHTAARCGHLTLYALMIALPVSGYIGSIAGGHEVRWFGLFTFPDLLSKDKALAEAGREAHFMFAWTIAFVLAAHLGGVVWHTAIRRDSVLTRMWPSYRQASIGGRS